MQATIRDQFSSGGGRLIAYVDLPEAARTRTDKGDQVTIRATWHGGRLVELDTGYGDIFDVIEADGWRWDGNGGVPRDQFIPENLRATLAAWIAETNRENLHGTLVACGDFAADRFGAL